ncbi:MAG: cytochrome P450, partial [Acidobacteria bacterium]|nr:cytochrome P450 [Acidobacteriota bacterium]
MLPQGPTMSAARQTLRWHLRPTDVLSEAAATYGTPFTLRILGRPPAVVLSDPEHVKAVFKGSPDLFVTGAANEGFRTHIGPDSLLTLDGPDHHRHRRLLNPPFHHSRMGAYAHGTWAGTVARIAEWSAGDEVRILPAMYELAFDLILESVFGVSNPEVLREFRRLSTILSKESSSIDMFLPFLRKDLGRFSAWGRFLRARREWDRMLYAEIDRALEEGSESRTDVLGLLARAGARADNPLSKGEIRDELMALLAAGHATTAVALTWMTQLTLSSPDVARRVREDVRGHFEGGGGPEDLDRLTFIDAVIYEALRLHPPIVLVVRQLVRDASIAGFDLPAGTLVRPCPYLTHRDPRIFPDPEDFKPERFMNGRPSNYEYYPFGGG